MKKTVRIIALACIIALLSGVMVSGANSASDPIITLGYIKNTLLPDLEKKASDKLTSAIEAVGTNKETDMRDFFADYENNISSRSFADAAASAVINSVKKNGGFVYKSDGGCDVRLYKGDKLTGDTGTEFVLKQGSASVTGPSGSEILDLSAGRSVPVGTAVSIYMKYMTSEMTNTGLSCVGDVSTVYVKGRYNIERRYEAQYTDIANALKSLGLFLGTDYGFELEKKASRIESLVMLIRMLGEEKAALNSLVKHPFTDVPAWADRYVAYAYQKGYTNGTSAKTFSPDLTVRADDYSTFVLRVLGYDDSKGDFNWSGATDFAVSKGVITAADKSMMTGGEFLRDYVVYYSKNALRSYLKGTQIKLIDKLVNSGAVSKSKLDSIDSSIWYM